MRLRQFYGIARLTGNELWNLNKTVTRKYKLFDYGNAINVRQFCLRTIFVHRQQSKTTNIPYGNELLSRKFCRFDRRFPFVESYSTEVTKSKAKQENTEVSTSVVENIKETTTTVSYTAIVLIGFGVIIAIVYAIFSELFSSKSAHSVYSRTFNYVINDEKVRKVFGNSIKAFGEETRRGRRQHVSHVQYTKDGKNYLRMKFYIKGNNGESGTVHLEMAENDKGKYEYRYLFVNVDGIRPTQQIIILEDNRGKFENYQSISKEAALSEEDFSLK